MAGSQQSDDLCRLLGFLLASDFRADLLGAPFGADVEVLEMLHKEQRAENSRQMSLGKGSRRTFENETFANP